ncbi:hypothetical protein E2C01_100371 [Portunus trituberculatus]|uniref:Uncharacterized protein n=1 Tax=Portunus trituberculatus TaxID=210409 RepID=A0A5B7K2V8_PORTR|nr:hypothetical protein [Portunus trituberculatus]
MKGKRTNCSWYREIAVGRNWVDLTPPQQEVQVPRIPLPVLKECLSDSVMNGEWVLNPGVTCPLVCDRAASNK